MTAPPTAETTSSYWLCSTPRSGSYRLAEALINTGVAGRPTEYFSSGYYKYWSHRWKPASYGEYIEMIRSVGTTSNGVFGCKIHGSQLAYLSRQLFKGQDASYAGCPAMLAHWFPAMRYIRLRRRDRVAQAVSYVRAIHTNLWWDADVDPAPFDPPRPGTEHFDALVIERCMTRMENEDRTWTEYFSAIGVEPLTFDFEDLIRDIDGALAEVLEYLELELPAGYTPLDTQFRKQSDKSTDEWMTRFESVRGRVVAPRSTVGVTFGASETTSGPVRAIREWLPRTETEPPKPLTTPVSESSAAGRFVQSTPAMVSNASIDPNGELAGKLASRLWWVSRSPFPFAVCDRVFTDEVYNQLVDAFRKYEAEERFGREIPGYDVTAMTITPDIAGPFSVFVSRPWHDLLESLFQVRSTGELNVSLHRHAVGSESGTPHNDLNPGWFNRMDSDGLNVYDPRRCNYQTGASFDGSEVYERIRAVAVIYYFASPSPPGVGGDTGLYRSTSDPIDRPAVRIRPRNNSLIAFKCTPYSFHGFITNRTKERNCLVMWLHQSRDDVEKASWGPSIVGWNSAR